MAENKKSFVLYSDQKSIIDMLPDELAGKLLKHIYAYVNDENPVTDNPMVALAFEPIKLQLKRDLQKWEETKDNFSKAGKASAQARKIKKQQLYVIECSGNNERFIKVGITDNSISQRYSSIAGGNKSIPYNFDVIGQHFFAEGEISPIDLEMLISQNFKKYSPKIHFAGHMECFNVSDKEALINFIQHRSTSFNIVQQTPTNPTVNDNVTVNVNDNVTVINIEPKSSIEYDFEKIKTELKENQYTTKQFVIQQYKLTLDQYLKFVDIFVGEKDNDLHKPLDEVLKHFKNWVRTNHVKLKKDFETQINNPNVAQLPKKLLQ